MRWPLSIVDWLLRSTNWLPEVYQIRSTWRSSVTCDTSTPNSLSPRVESTWKREVSCPRRISWRNRILLSSTFTSRIASRLYDVQGMMVDWYNFRWIRSVNQSINLHGISSEANADGQLAKKGQTVPRSECLNSSKRPRHFITMTPRVFVVGLDQRSPSVWFSAASSFQDHDFF